MYEIERESHETCELRWDRITDRDNLLGMQVKSPFPPNTLIVMKIAMERSCLRGRSRGSFLPPFILFLQIRAIERARAYRPGKVERLAGPDFGMSFYLLGDINRSSRACYNYTVIMPLVARSRTTRSERAEKTKEG